MKAKAVFLIDIEDIGALERWWRAVRIITTLGTSFSSGISFNFMFLVQPPVNKQIDEIARLLVRTRSVSASKLMPINRVILL